MSFCYACGMPVGPEDVYHPHTACVMYEASRDAEMVKANLAAVVEHGAATAYAACATLVRAAGCLCFHLVVFVESGEDFDGEIDYEGPEGAQALTVTKHDYRCPQALALAIEARAKAPSPEVTDV